MQPFSHEQKRIRIGSIEIGGRVGELPTVLIGSVFHEGDRAVSDPAGGIFDEGRVKELLDRERELTEATGLPRIVDIIAQTSQAMKRYLDFILTATDSPFLIDSPDPKVRMEGVSYLCDLGAIDRAIYNSLDTNATAEEIDFIGGLGVKNAVILAFDAKHIRPKDRPKLLLGEEGKAGLIDIAERSGIENLLIDVGVLDLPSLGWSAQAIWQVKEELGYPCGCAPSNGLYMWKRRRKVSGPAFRSAGAIAISLPITYGADFILYGPLVNAEWVYPACAMLDAVVSYGARVQGTRSKNKEHPLYKIF